MRNAFHQDLMFRNCNNDLHLTRRFFCIHSKQKRKGLRQKGGRQNHRSGVAVGLRPCRNSFLSSDFTNFCLLQRNKWNPLVFWNTRGSDIARSWEKRNWITQLLKLMPAVFSTLMRVVEQRGLLADVPEIKFLQNYLFASRDKPSRISDSMHLQKTVLRMKKIKIKR